VRKKSTYKTYGGREKERLDSLFRPVASWSGKGGSGKNREGPERSGDENGAGGKRGRKGNAGTIVVKKKVWTETISEGMRFMSKKNENVSKKGPRGMQGGGHSRVKRNLQKERQLTFKTWARMVSGNAKNRRDHPR